MKELGKVSVAGKLIYAGLSFDELLFFENAIKEKRTDYYNIIVDTFVKCENLTKSKIKVEEVKSLIHAIIFNDDIIRKKYNVIEVEDEYGRFIIAALEVVKDSASSIKKSFSEKIPNYDFSKMVNNIAASFDAIKIEALSEEFKNAIAIRHSLISNLVNSIKRVHWPIIETLNDNLFKEIQSRLSAVLQSVKFPNITDEEKDRLQQSYAEWGNIGWTIPPFAEAFVFNRFPNNINAANRKMDALFRGNEMQEIFAELRKMNLKQSDLNEAIDNYEMKRYKSSAMLLFGLIDAKMIRLQLESDKSRNMRPSGSCAANNILNRIKTRISDNMLFALLDQVNLSAAFATIFERGNDFKKQPGVINRHFVIHGMLHRRVSKRDCIQLFLLLYNMMHHFDLLKENAIEE